MIFFVCVCVCVCVCVRARACARSLSVTAWTVAHQAPLIMGFPRQAYWSGLPFPPPGDLPNPGIEPESFASLAKQLDPFFKRLLICLAAPGLSCGTGDL